MVYRINHSNINVLLISELLVDRQLATLTKREQEVLDKLLAGNISKQIARELGISTRTVEVHRQNLLRKLGVRSVKELLLHPIARERGE